MDDKIIGLPNFLEALASIITELDEVKHVLRIVLVHHNIHKI